MSETLVLSIAGVLLIGLTGLLVSVLAWLGKYALQTLDKRIDVTHTIAKTVEDKTHRHETAIATANANAANARADMHEMNGKIDRLGADVTNTHLAVTEIRALLTVETKAASQTRRKSQK